MSRTLNLVTSLLARGRKLRRLGVTQEAFLLFSRLAGLAMLPGAAAQVVQKHLALIQLKRRRYAQARRHLAAVLTHEPGNAMWHYRMAQAVAADPRCDRGRAVAHCRRAAELAPKHAGYLSTFGLLALRRGLAKKALAALRQAAALAPNEPRVLRRVARGLCLLRRAEEARSVLLAALFRNAGDHRFRALWRRFQFEQLYGRQVKARRQATVCEGGASLLPFARPCTNLPAGEVSDVRKDAPAMLPAPHMPCPVWRPDQRHAQ
jgi:tetratricopeptide (TPR) repeat protein